MKKFRILGIIAIACMIGNIALNFEGSWNSFKKGYEEGYNSHNTIPDNLFPVSLEVLPIEGTANDTIFNPVTQQKTPFHVSGITTYVQLPIGFTFSMIGFCLSAIAFAFSFFGFTCLLIEVSKQNVFCKRNVWRIRFFVYSYTSVQLFFELNAWLEKNAAIEQIQIPGYQIINYAETSTEWLPIIMVVILAECFAIGVKMKEEQDLTV